MDKKGVAIKVDGEVIAHTTDSSSMSTNSLGIETGFQITTRTNVEIYGEPFYIDLGKFVTHSGGFLWNAKLMELDGDLGIEVYDFKRNYLEGQFTIEEVKALSKVRYLTSEVESLIQDKSTEKDFIEKIIKGDLGQVRLLKVNKKTGEFWVS